MIKHHIKLAIRNFRKKSSVFAINLLGLTIAIVSFLAILLYIQHEWGYDRMYADFDRIYKVNQNFETGEDSRKVGTTPSSLIPSILEEVPEVETGTLVFDLSIFSTVVVSNGDIIQEESKFAYADHNFFNVFDFEVLHGNPTTALTEPNQIVLTASTAERYFGTTANALGKSLKINGGADYYVSAVMVDFPSNSHLDFDFISSFATHRHGKTPEWSPSNYYTYIKVREGISASLLEPKLNQLIDKYIGEELKSYNMRSTLLLNPIKDIHFDDSELQGNKPGSNKAYLYIFGIIAIIIILVGIINYINLATAEATERNKEVGIRKVLGAERKQLFTQFIAESLILTTISMLISIMLIYLLKSSFENITGVPAQINLIYSSTGIFVLLAIIVVVGILSGSYPAFVLSGMQPLRSIGKNGSSGGVIWLRKSLVIFQFFISIGLLIATLIIQYQLSYMQSVNLGYDKEQLISINTHYNMRSAIPTLKSELLRTGVAASISQASESPILIKGGYSITPGGDNTRTIDLIGYPADAEIIETLTLEVLEGEDFNDQDLSRTTANENQIEFPVILNEAAIRHLGWDAAEAVGKSVYVSGTPTIVKAIVKDFYFNSLHHEVSPLGIFIEPEQANVLLIRLEKGNPTEHLAKMKDIWQQLVPERPFNYSFVDQDYARMYQSEEKVGTIFSIFSAIAVFIACMGLFGLVSYIALKKTREISIRKVLGANSLDVLKVLSNDFFGLLIISSFMAIAFGLWFSKVWLNSFAYKVKVSPSIFVLAILIVASISLLTIGYRAIKVYLLNPVEALKGD
ncbi:ABC transporter permease [Peijinzhouia sedimentorum]